MTPLYRYWLQKDPEIIKGYVPFECSNIRNIAHEMIPLWQKDYLTLENIYLPAGKTLLEFNDVDGVLLGLMCERLDDNNFKLYHIDQNFKPMPIAKINRDPNQSWQVPENVPDELAMAAGGLCVCMLYIINQPQIGKVVEKHPSRQMVRAYKRGGPEVVSWSMVKLKKDVTLKRSERTGQGCSPRYHFTRKHTVTVNGKVYPRREHWKGDISKGIIMPSYETVDGKQ